MIRKSATLDWRSLFALTLIFSGGLGNLIDRILYDRHVTDFMNLGVFGLRTGIFNFADVYITLGVILALFFYREKG
jgi:signal peptidase II